MGGARQAKVGLALAAGALAVMATWMAGGLGALNGQASGQARATGVLANAAVIRTDVASREQVAATLGFQPLAPLVAQATATITQLPTVGALIRRGGALYEADGQPVRLLYGARAAWRSLELGVIGADVSQLKRNLIALGYAPAASFALNGDFDLATASAVERWQAAQGITPTGLVGFGAIAFLPGPVRVGATLALAGAPVQPGTPVLALTSPELEVSVALDPTLRQLVHRGDLVSIQLPAGNEIPGRVAGIAAEASATGSAPSSAPDVSSQGAAGSAQGASTISQPTIAVSISLSHPRAAEGLDQVPVSVQITDSVRRGVLAVPVGALLALAEGGYAVATYEHGQRNLIGVRTGVFDGGRVEVSGRGVKPGMLVEVPGP